MKQLKLMLTDEEHARIVKLSRIHHETISNYVRHRIHLEPRQQGVRYIAGPVKARKA